ncbi:MAG: hypothetical protein ACRDGL_06085 [Candidatus Limnocylindrales bacterium]
MTVSQVLREGAEALISGQVIVNYVSITNTQGTPGMEAPTILVMGSPSGAGRSISAEVSGRG